MMLKSKDLRTPMIIVGLLIGIANSIVLYLSFLHAFFFNDMMLIVNINGFGEAYVEFFLLPLALLLFLYAGVITIKQKVTA